jgi:ABC-2 type transport system ATP-binding protein
MGTDTTAKQLVCTDGLTKRYGQFVAVRNLDLEVETGEVFALLGPNGAGKTTTMRMLMGILQPAAGSASICGLDCFSHRAEVMRHVGYVPDEPAFFPYLRGREILLFVGHMHGIDAGATLDQAEGLIEAFQLGDAMEDFAVNYSHGMKKKLAVLCALAHRPKVLILDEPTNGLDPFATRHVHQLIRDHAEAGGAVLLSTHLLDQAQRLADRVGILHKGELAAIGKLEELQTRAAGSKNLEELFFAVTSDQKVDGQASKTEPGITQEREA